jgi:ribonuclease HI
MSASSLGLYPHPNNRMELEAVIQGLAALRAPCGVEFYTDLEDVLTLLNGGRARTHHDAVARLLAAAAPHYLTPHDVRGHAGHPENECVDAFAQQAASTGVRSRRRGQEERS